MKRNLAELVYIVDRSGSMAGLESDTIGGINANLARNREAEGDANVSIVLFDNEPEVIVDRKPIGNVPDLTARDYQVRGCTALLDALGGSMRHIERVQRYMPEGHKADKVIFVITTDGLENSSREYSVAEVRREVERHTEEGWEFLFLGANIDAVQEAGRIGIRADRAATYVADELGSKVMYDAVADASVHMRCGSAPLDAGWKREIEEDARSRG
ncbi:MAG: vWA domain-containing protein [Coriobacteriales bacterium]